MKHFLSAGRSPDDVPIAIWVRRVLGAVAAVPQLPSELRAEVLVLLPHLRELERLHQHDGRRCVFAPAAEPGVWWVGDESAPLRLPGRGLGLMAAWRAIKGEAPACADLVSPGSVNAMRTVRKALQESAVPWAEQSGCRALVVAIQRIQRRAGRLHYARRTDDVEVVPFWSPPLPAIDSGVDHSSSSTR